VTSKKLRVLIAKDPAGNVTAIGVPNPKFANKIGLHAPTGGTVETIDVAARSKRETARLDEKMVEELLATGRLTAPSRPPRSKRR
jgi:hypothetical protein